MRRTGQLYRWIDDRGFGFIRDDETSKEYFVHYRAFPVGCRWDIDEGQYLTFEIGVSNRDGGHEAKAVEFV